MRLLRLEIRRALHRKVVVWLIIVALLGCVVFGLVVWFSATDHATNPVQYRDEGPELMRTWWRQERSDGIPIVTAIFLIFGAVVAGASVAGAEWKYNTITSLLVSEPRRNRVLIARFAAAAILAFLIAIVLQCIFVAAALPSVFAHGSTEVSGNGWWLSLGLLVIRVASITAAAAVIAEAIATIGRNTVVGLVVVFGWLAVVEGFIRGLRPGWVRWLWTQNAAVFLPWTEPDSVSRITPAQSMLLILAYCIIICGASVVVFNRRDIASVS